VDITLVGWDPIGAGDPEANGFWVELADASGEVVYRRVQQDPTHGAEVFSPTGQIARTSGRSRTGTFVVLVPVLEAATHVILWGSFEAEGKYRVSRQLARFELPDRDERGVTR
jgi:hypothetical protein